MKSGWSKKSFENSIEKVTYTQKVQQKDFLPQGEFPIISQEEDFINGYWNNEAALFKITKPVVAFGDHTKVLKYIDFDFVLGADGVKILQPQDFLLPKFFYYQLQALNLTSLGYARHYKLLKELEIFYPARSEQQRLVDLLDEAFDGIITVKTNTEKNLQNARALSENYLQRIFTQQGKSWDRMTLEVLLERGWIEDHMDGNHGSNYPRKEEFISEGLPYISANCMADDRLDLSCAKYLSPSRAALLRKGFAKNDDVLFAHNATVGPVAILRTDEEKTILGTSLTYYRCNPKYILPAYLAHYMRSFEFKTQYQSVMRQSTRNQVPITKQREFFHIIPPLREQRAIISELDSLFNVKKRLESLYQLKLIALNELKKSLLDQVFTGQL